MRISDWSSDVCSSDLPALRCGILGDGHFRVDLLPGLRPQLVGLLLADQYELLAAGDRGLRAACDHAASQQQAGHDRRLPDRRPGRGAIEPSHLSYLSRLMRSEEHTSELQSLMRISYAVFCLKKKKKKNSKL